MIGKDHPCARGLTPECFEKYPNDAKRAFAYRLMNSLFPPRITMRLPRIFRPWDYDWGVMWLPWLYYIFEDWLLLEEPLPEGWMPGDPLPPGEIIQPGGDVPPGWTPGDPLPPGVVVDPGVVFPPGWTPEMPLPPGVIVPLPPDFPPGWTPGDPLPPGVVEPPPPAFPPGWTPGDPLPPGVGFDPKVPPPKIIWRFISPLYVRIWEPGPAHRPSPWAPSRVIWFFYEHFGNLDQWTPWTWGDGEYSIAGYLLTLYYTYDTGNSTAGIRRTETRAWPENWTWSFKFQHVTGERNFCTLIYTGTIMVRMRLDPPNTIWFWIKDDVISITVDNFIGITHVWKIVVTGLTGSLYRDDTPIQENMELQPSTLKPGRMEHWNEGNTVTQTDDYLITVP